jgi:hypothetical protein
MFGVIAGFVAAATLWVLLFIFQFGAPLNSSSRWTGDSLRIKQEAARVIQGPKIAIIAGSSGHFSISAEQIESALGLPAVNLSLHAGLGFPYILEKARQVLCSGDWAIIAPEYEVFFSSVARTDLLIDHVVARDPDYFLSAGLGEQLGIVSGIGPNRLLKGVMAQMGLRLPPPTTGYNASTISRWGDEQSNVGGRYGGDPQPIEGESISTGDPGVTAILDFLDWAKASGISVFAAFPPYPNLSAQSELEVIAQGEKVMAFWEQHGVAMLGEPAEYFYPSSLFFDTSYHLNVQGRTVHTRRLIAHIFRAAPAFAVVREDHPTVKAGAAHCTDKDWKRQKL